MVVEIRPYQRADREVVLRIAADTAFFGNPVAAFLPGRRVMLDAFVRYYTDCESRHTWIADVDGTVAAPVPETGTGSGRCLTGGVGGALTTLCQVRTVAGALGKLVLGRYRRGRRGRSDFMRLAGVALRGGYPRADLRRYPAHPHINLVDGYRGLGLGCRLMGACFRQMAGMGVDGIHSPALAPPRGPGNTTSLNTAAIRLCERMGFQLLGSRPTRLWEWLLPNTVVINLLYGRHFIPADAIIGGA